MYKLEISSLITWLIQESFYRVNIHRTAPQGERLQAWKIIFSVVANEREREQTERKKGKRREKERNGRTGPHPTSKTSFAVIQTASPKQISTASRSLNNYFSRHGASWTHGRVSAGIKSIPPLWWNVARINMRLNVTRRRCSVLDSFTSRRGERKKDAEETDKFRDYLQNDSRWSWNLEIYYMSRDNFYN